MALARLYDFIPNTVISSSQVDDEFNQIINALNGTLTTADYILVLNSATLPVLKLNQQGGGPILAIQQGGVDKVVVTNSGLVQFQAGLDVVGGTGIFPNTGLRVRDTNASHVLIIKPGSDLTADRTLTFVTGDIDRTLTLNGNVSLSNPIAASEGGTGQNTYTKGDLLVATGATTLAKLAADTSDGYVLTTAAAQATGVQWKMNTSLVTTSTFTVTNSTALSAVPGLSVNVRAGRKYIFRAVLFVDADATGGHKYAIGGSATAAAVKYHIRSINDATNAFVITSRQTALGGSAGQAGATTVFTEIVGAIDVSAAGTLNVQFAQNAANGSSSVLALSFFEVVEV
ncbi:MAG: hypothetical protein QW838_02875 [Candidatus Nitrosotenuis sp.]